MAFTLEFYRPNLDYLIPNNGTTLLGLNLSSYGTTSIQTIDESVDLGSTAVNMNSIQLYKKNGAINQNYSRPDRTIKFNLFLMDTSDSDVNLRATIRYIQTLITEATLYTVSTQSSGNTGRVIGYPLMLKYQPQTLVSPVFFQIKNGNVNVGTFHHETELLNYTCTINIELTTNYQAWGYGTYWDNDVVNGTFAYGGKDWDMFQQTNSSYGSAPMPLGTSVAFSTDRFDYSSFYGLMYINPNNTLDTTLKIAAGYLPSDSNFVTWVPAIQRGYDYLWGFADSTSGVFSEMTYKPYATTTALVDNVTRSDITYSLNRFGPGLDGSPSNTYWLYDTPVQGTWGTLSNKIYSSTDTNNDLITINPGGGAAGYNSFNQATIQVNMLGTLNSGSVFSIPNLVFRYSNSTNYMYARCYNGNVQLVVNNNGSTTIVATATQAMADNTSYTLKVILNGPNVQVFVNGTQKINYTDSTPTYPKFKSYYRVGFFLQKGGAPATAAKWSAFSVDFPYEVVTSTIVENLSEYSQFGIDYKDEQSDGINPITDYFDKTGVLNSGDSLTSGGTWTKVSGSSTVTANPPRNIIASTSSSVSLYTTNLGASDCFVDVGTNLTSISGNEAGLVFRYSNSTNYWIATLSGLTVSLKKIVAGTPTTVGTFTTTTDTVGTGSTIRVKAIGNNINVFFYDSNTFYSLTQNNGDNPSITASDSFNSTATNVGLYWAANSVRPLDTFKAASSNAAIAGVQARSSQNGNWNITGEIFYLNNNTNWTSYKWGNPTLSSKESTFTTGKRVFITISKTATALNLKHFRKIFLNRAPLTDTFANYLPSSGEYMSQAGDTGELCVLVGIKGTMESNLRLAINNRPRFSTIDTTGASVNDVVIYQQAHVGMRKMIGSPINFHHAAAVDYTCSFTTGQQVTSTTNVLIPFQNMDLIPRRYKIVLNISTNNTTSFWVASNTGDSKAMFKLVPNQVLAEIPNTSSTFQYVDVGTFTLMPNNIKSISTNNSLSGLPVNFDFGSVASTTAGTVTIKIRDIWFIPADDINSIDTRTTNTIASTSLANYNNAWATTGVFGGGSNQLILDSLMTERLDVYYNTKPDLSSNIFPTLSANTNNIYRLFPATTNSPQPMAIGAVVRRQGSNGNPATTIQVEPIEYNVIYCPAYEF